MNIPNMPAILSDKEIRKQRKRRLKRLQSYYSKVHLAWRLFNYNDIFYETECDIKNPKAIKSYLKKLTKYYNAAHAALVSFNYYDLRFDEQIVETLEITLEKFNEYRKEIQNFLSNLCNFVHLRIAEIKANKPSTLIALQLKEIDIKDFKTFKEKIKTVEKILVLLTKIVQERIYESLYADINNCI